MGTNYYLKAQMACSCCGRPYEDLHIGKHSAGWEFLFATHPNLGINSAQDWWLEARDRQIVDEYGNSVLMIDFWCMVDESRGKRAARAWDEDTGEYRDPEGYRMSTRNFC